MEGKNSNVSHVLAGAAAGLLVTVFAAWMLCELVRL